MAFEHKLIIANLGEKMRVHPKYIYPRALLSSKSPSGKTNGLQEHPKHIKRKELYASFKAWIPIALSYIKENPHGPLYFGPTSPFPYNLDFKSTTPPSDNLKTLIFDTYQQDPQYWTVRRLSRVFLLSIERIEAILRLKMTQVEMVKRGFQIDSEFVARMETAIGVNITDHLPFAKRLEHAGHKVDIIAGEIFSDRIASIQDNLKKQETPFFIKVAEGTTLTPTQAGALLERDVVVAREYLSTRPLLKDNELLSIKHTIIRNDKVEQSKQPFIIVDVGPCDNPRNRIVYVRDINGDLREATDVERLREAKRLWGYDSARFLGAKALYDPSMPRPFPKIPIPWKFFKKFTYQVPNSIKDEITEMQDTKLCL